MYVFCGLLASRNISDWWLAYWISHEKQHHRDNRTISSRGGSIDSTTKFYITVYGGLAGANTVSALPHTPYTCLIVAFNAN